MNKISVITIVKNDAIGLLKTIESVKIQTLRPFQYILIDGGSSDNTKEIVSQNKDYFSLIISEDDKGIYDAMNKGIKNAAGDWLIFMNAGDIFYSGDAVAYLQKEIERCGETDIFYSDTVIAWRDKKRTSIASHREKNFIHQSICYKKKLHNEFGNYLSINRLSVSDYLFFIGLPETTTWKKLKNIISEIDPYGLSSNSNTYRQKTIINILLNFESLYKGGAKLLIHPLYYRIKKILKSRYK